MLKIGIVGSRSRNKSVDMYMILDGIEDLMALYFLSDYMLISGGCATGGDKFAEDIARMKKVSITIFSPQKLIDDGDTKDFTQACFMRNTQIAKECDVLIACWDGNSRGTLDTIKKVVQLRKRVYLV